MPRDTIPLRYVEHGVGGAGPVVLIHGFPLTGAMWDDQISALADRYHLIVPDLRGHGATDAPPGPYAMEQMAGDVLALLDSLGVRRAAIVGLSMGGYIAIQIVTRSPERVSALVLADTRGLGDDTPRREARAAQADVIRADGLGAFSEIVLPRMFSAAAYQGRPDSVERFRQTIVGQKPEAVLAALEGLASRPDMLDSLRAVRCLTLIVVGSEDAATTPDDARDLHAAIDGSTLVVLEGAGHMTNWEAADAFNEALRSFLDRTVGK